MSDRPEAELEGLPPLRDVIAAHGLSARKGLGQHFLLDLNLTHRIARAAGELSSGTVGEIGPGPGGLTRSLLAEGARNLVAVERDSRCIAALEPLALAAQGKLRIVEGDAREVDVSKLGPAPLKIVANLPYNVATPLLIGWLSGGAEIAEMVLMFQREVADRITAQPGTKAYGRLSVVANWRAETRRLFTVPARAFTPPPRVDSAVVSLIPRTKPLHPADPADLEATTAAAFGQRRKMLRRSLATLPVEAARLLEMAEVDGNRRAETLTVAEFAALARAFSALRADP